MKRLLLTALVFVSANVFAQSNQFSALETLEKQIKERTTYILQSATKCMNGVKAKFVGWGMNEMSETLANARLLVKCSYISSPECNNAKLAQAEKELVELVNSKMSEGTPVYNQVRDMFAPEKCNGDESYHAHLKEVAQMTKSFYAEFYRLKEGKPASPAPGQMGQSFDLRMAERFTPPLRGHGTSL